jgi:hypothetical protein
LRSLLRYQQQVDITLGACAQQRELAVGFRRCFRQGLGARLLILSGGGEILERRTRLAKRLRLFANRRSRRVQYSKHLILLFLGESQAGQVWRRNIPWVLMPEPGAWHGFAAGVVIDSTHCAMAILARTRGPRRKPHERVRQDDPEK